jgi:hypothetical protein
MWRSRLVPCAHHFNDFVRLGTREDVEYYLTGMTFQETKSNQVKGLTLVTTMRNKKASADIPLLTFGEEFSWMT